MPWRGVARVFVCLMAVQVVNAAYPSCTATGTECQDANYAGGHFTDQPTLQSACDSDASCASYQWS